MSRMLKFGSSPNYETPMDEDTDNTYMVTVKASYGTDMATRDVTVTVTDVDELGALSGDSSPSYMENSDDDVATYTADGATWSLEGADKGYFTIIGGMLKFKNSPNYEMPRGAAMSATNTNEYMVTVKAEAGGEMDEIMVTVTVDNVEELGMLPGDSSHSYMENSDDAVATYTADGPMADSATWSLEGTDKGYFTIIGGMLKFKNSPNYEMPRGAAMSDTNTNEYMVTVKAEAGGEMDEITVTVMVTNVNEDGTVTLMPMPLTVGTAVTASLTDPDNVTDGTVTWQWSKFMEMDEGYTDITGATSAMYTPVAADEDYYLKATASYNDGEGSDKSASAMTASQVSSFAISGTSVSSYVENGDGRRWQPTQPPAPMADFRHLGSLAWRPTPTILHGRGFRRERHAQVRERSPDYEMPRGHGRWARTNSYEYMVTLSRPTDGTNSGRGHDVTVMVDQRGRTWDAVRGFQLTATWRTATTPWQPTRPTARWRTWQLGRLKAPTPTISWSRVPARASCSSSVTPPTSRSRGARR